MVAEIQKTEKKRKEIVTVSTFKHRVMARKALWSLENDKRLRDVLFSVYKYRLFIKSALNT